MGPGDARRSGACALGARRRWREQPRPPPALATIRPRRPLDCHRLLRTRRVVVRDGNRIRGAAARVPVVVSAARSPCRRRLRTGRRGLNGVADPARLAMGVTTRAFAIAAGTIQLAHSVAARECGAARRSCRPGMDAARGRGRHGGSDYARRDFFALRSAEIAADALVDADCDPAAVYRTKVRRPSSTSSRAPPSLAQGSFLRAGIHLAPGASPPAKCVDPRAHDRSDRRASGLPRAAAAAAGDDGIEADVRLADAVRVGSGLSVIHCRATSHLR